ncbi:uncharacterized protein BO97DRAFT_420349 [Aspergillus homomorphus CBS 101889]|uniref:NAD(P)-binding protein n=1 Tax=Aspergillus homomorphus (strain CBS 101889) TaxID=1450537 RepID=A0A395I9X3_ASPHC|nr:hypothetical protein BO97DRAFT_420349 [Aspergillus homomorphus CBS 101889]RAL16967.1 hypothetical protein BO97DRAFT_420349 [Aspergillus homomorphus CBS 101889]
MASSIPHSVFRPGATALITGAASAQLSQATAELTPSKGSSTSTQVISAHNLDVASPTAWRALMPTIQSQHPNGIDLLMLNAGAGFPPRQPDNWWTTPNTSSAA